MIITLHNEENWDKKYLIFQITHTYHELVLHVSNKVFSLREFVNQLEEIENEICYCTRL